MSWFTELFINQVKPALEYHSGLGSGNGSGSGSDDTQMYILVDEDGNEYPAVLVDEETVFDATANDIREGKVAATDDGVTVGTKEIPGYITTEGVQVIPSGERMMIKPLGGKHNYTKLLAVICPFNTTVDDSVEVAYTCINNKVYPAGSNSELYAITVDDTAEAIDLGFTNEWAEDALIRYFTYKEEF